MHGESGETIEVLLVDDDPDLADCVATFLARIDDQFAITTAIGSQEGISALGEREVDCVVSDYDMPETNGLEFLEAVRTDNPDVPFILFTGKGSEEIAARAIEAGVDSYLQKESGTDQYRVLANRIRNHVEQYREQARADRLEKEYSLIAETASDAFWVSDLTTGTTRIDGVHRFGYDVERIDFDFDWWLERIHPDDRESVHQRVEARLDRDEAAFDELTADRGRFSDEYRFRRADGTYAHCSDRGILLFDSGEPAKMVGVMTDVTEQKEREQDLRETKHRLDLVLDETNTGVWEWNLETGEFALNETMERTLGLEPETFGGTFEAFTQRVHPDDIRQVEEAIVRAVENDEPCQLEFRMVREDGSTTWVGARGAVLRDEDAPDRMVGVQHNITERKESESELRRQRTLVQGILNAIPDVVFAYDDDGDHIVADALLGEFAGYPKAELAEMELPDFLPEEDRGAAREQVRLTLEDGETVTFETEIVTKDGERIPHEYRAAPMELDGEVLGVAAAARDITDRKEREQELEALRDHTEFALEATNTLIWSLDVDTDEIIALHGSVESLYGVEVEPLRNTEAVFENIVHPDDVEKAEQEYEDLQQGERTQIDVEYRTHPDNGEVRWVKTHGHLQTDADSRRLVSISTDVTERKRRERELMRQNDRLEDFASIVSHDLRNPLNVAQGRSKLAREECPSEHLDHVVQAHERMEALIADLLTLAKEGERVTDIEAVDLTDAVERSWRNVRTREATLVTDVESTVRADPARLQQLLENLVRNAVEHGGDDVTVTVGERDDGSGFYVADDGPGIPHDERDQVFESGYSTSEEGTGYGLSIVKAIADAHNWEIVVADSDDGGVRFDVIGIEQAD